MNKNRPIGIILKTLPVLLILNTASSLAAAEWPWQQAADQKTKSSAAVPVNAAPGAVMEQSHAEAMTQRANDRTAQPMSASTVPADKQPGAANVQNSYTIKVPQRNANYEEAVKLQAKLNDLLRVSSEMDRVNRSKVAAVQSMVDKARMNQKILSMLSTPGDATAKIRKADSDQILMSKKLRGMREEAEKQIALAHSHQENASPVSRKTA